MCIRPGHAILTLCPILSCGRVPAGFDDHSRSTSQAIISPAPGPAVPLVPDSVTAVNVSETVQLAGEIRPAPGRKVTPEEVRELLRERQILGAVGRHEADTLTQAAGIDESELAVLVTLAATSDEKVLVLDTDGAARPGPELADLCGDLAEILQADVDIAGEFHSGYPDEDDPEDQLDESDEDDGGLVFVDMPERTDPAPVMVCRLPSEMWPALARDAGSPLSAVDVDGWTLIQFEDTDADTGEHAFLRSEGPVAELSSIDGERYLNVLAKRGLLMSGATLTRLAPMRPSYDIDELGSDDPAVTQLLATLANPHLEADSQMRMLLAEERFAQVDAAQLAATLQLPDDAHWFCRVLEVLGLPVIAAEVFEGAALPEGAERVEPGSFMATLKTALRNYEHAGQDEVSRRGPLGRLYAASVRRPVLALLTIIPEVLVGLALLYWTSTADDRPWWLFVLAGVGVLVLLDALIDLVLMIRRMRRGAGVARN